MRDHAKFAIAPATSSDAAPRFAPVGREGDRPGMRMRQKLAWLDRDRGTLCR